MNANATQSRDYLLELYRKTKGEPGAQVSMFDVGAALNLEKERASKIAEDLIGDGLVEVKTLSGGIGITAEGIEQAQADGGSVSGTTGLSLGKDPVLDKKSKEAVTVILKEIQGRIIRNTNTYAQIEEMVIDMKTIEVQLLSPRPKTAIVRQVLRSLQSALSSAGDTELSDKLGGMVAD